MAWFCKTWIEFWFAKLVCPHNCAPWIRLDPNIEWYTTFKMTEFVLCLILLRIPIAWFSLIFIWAIWLFHWRCLSNNTPSHFIDCDGLNLFPSRLSLRLWSNACSISVKDLNLVLEILRVSLFALRHCKRLFRSCANFWFGLLIWFESIFR